MEFFFELDRWLLYAINRGLKNPVFDWLMPVASNFELIILPLAALVVYSIWKGTWHTRWAFLMIAICFAITDPLTSKVLKPFFDRPRPYNSLGDIYIYSKSWIFLTHAIGEQSISFPSTHAVNSAAAATLIAWFFPRWKWLAGGVALLVCFSRIYLGMHYPSDILAGIIVGVGCASALIVLNRVAISKFPDKFKWLKVGRAGILSKPETSDFSEKSST